MSELEIANFVYDWLKSRPQNEDLDLAKIELEQAMIILRSSGISLNYLPKFLSWIEVGQSSGSATWLEVKLEESIPKS